MGKQILILALLIFTTIGCTQADHINGLIQKLGDKNPTVSQAAANELVRIGAPAVNPLVIALKNKDSEIQNRASVTLVRIGLPSIDPLIITFSSTDNETIEAASETLAIIGGPAVEKLIAEVDNPDEKVRYQAIKTLGKIKDGSAVESLIRHLKDPSNSVRTAAIKALTLIGLSATEQLINAAKSPDEDLQMSAITILGDIRDIRGIPVLIESLTDDNSTINQSAAVALGKIGLPAVDPLVALYKTSSASMKGRIYYALCETKDDKAFKLCEQHLYDELASDDAKVRQTAATQFTAMGLPNSIKAFSSVLARGKYKTEAAEEIEKMGEPALEAILAKTTGINAYTQGIPFSLDLISTVLRMISRINIKGTHIEVMLLNAIEEKDISTIEFYYPYYIQRGEPNSEILLIEALRGVGLCAPSHPNCWSKTLLEDYLNCGNKQLAEAARNRAVNVGYYVETTFSIGGQGPKWGERK